MKKNIEAEGGELILRDENGTVAIIPKNKRGDALDYLKSGCNDCLKNMISQLPLYQSKAETGTVVENDVEFNEIATKYTSQGWNALSQQEQDTYRTLYDVKYKSPNTLPEVEVKAQKIADEYASYAEAPHVSNIKMFQRDNQLVETGKIDKDTEKLLRNRTMPKQLSDRYYSARQERDYYQESVKRYGQKYSSGDFFGMNPKKLEALMKTNPTAKSHQCIGGVCNFLSQVDKKALSKEYHSNFEFEKQAKEEGWLQYKDTKLTYPDIGDVLVATKNEYTGGLSKHAKIIIDYDGENYTVLDNRGEDKARVAKVTKEKMREEIERTPDIGQYKYEFFRRVKYGDENIADLQREIGEFELPQEYRPKQYDIETPPKVNYIEGLSKDYTYGINRVLETTKKSDIPQEDLSKLAKIINVIPKNESEFGEGMMYKIEKYVPVVAKGARWAKRGVDTNKPLSVGLSQINPEMLPKSIKEKYFKGMSDLQIEQKLRKDDIVTGKVSMELIMDRYRYLRDNPELYTNDTSKFWYTLIKSWQAPNYAKSEKGRKNIQDLNVAYSENILKELK